MHASTWMPVYNICVDVMTPDQAKQPPIFDGVPDEDPDDGRDEASGDAIASERRRKRRVIALIIIMLLGVIAVIFPPLLALL
jgi:hypothetical protein